MRTEVKIGLFTLSAFAILLIISLRLVKIEMKGYTILVELSAAEGISKGTPVLMAGIKIGEVKELELSEDGSRAIAKITIIEEVKITDDVKAKLRMKGILGDRYIMMIQGKSKKFLEEGAVIKDVEVPGSPEDLIESLSGAAMKVEEISEEISRLVLDAERTLDEARYFIASLKEKADRSESALKSTLSSASETLISIKNSVDTFASEIKPVLRSLRRTLEGTGRSAEDIGEVIRNLKEISSLLSEGKGLLGKLIKDEKFAKELTNSLMGLRGEIKESISKIGSGIKDRINVEGEIEGEVSIEENPKYSQNIMLTLSYKSTFAELGLVVPPTYMRNPSFALKGTILLGKDFERFRLKGGIIRSAPGFGFDIPFSYFRASLETLKISSEPNLRGYLSICPIEYLMLIVGVEDVLNRMFPFVGLGVKP